MTSNKVTAGGIIEGMTMGGAAAVLLIWIMQAFGVPAEQFTNERVVALTTMTTGTAAFVSGYLIPHWSGRLVRHLTGMEKKH